MLLQNKSKTTTINNKKALLCSRAFLQRPSHPSDRQDPVFLNQANLLKFFPKYNHSIRIEVETQPIISKIKRVKILQGFHGYQSRTQSKNLKRTLLYNKEKFIQSFYDGDGPEFIDFKSLTQEIRTFTGLRILKILCGSHSSSDLKRICRYIRGLYKLDHLELKINSQDSMRIISKMNSYERLLESLVTLKIDCKWGSLWEKHPEDDIILFTNLSKNKNILKATTSLELGYLHDETFCEVFENTLASCPKLGSLLFESDCFTPDDKPLSEEEKAKLPQGNDVKPLTSRYLQVLGTLNHLHTVNVRCRNLFTFVRDFILPPSIQNVKITFQDFTGTFVFMGTPNNKNFKENLRSFLEKWKHLTNLTTLNLVLSQGGDKFLLTLMFLYAWLPRVCNIQHLILELSSAHSINNHWSEFSHHEDPFDVSVFFQVIQHLKNTLKTLAISDNWLVYSMKNLPKQPLDFPHLQKFCLRGFLLPQEVDLSQLFQVNLKDLLTNTEQPFELALEGLHFDSMGPFMDFMKSFDHERSGQRRFVKMKMAAYVKSQVARTFLDSPSRYFTLQARDLSIQMEVHSSGRFEAHEDPKLSLPKTLNYLKLKN